jgi:hypothetical protein
MNPNNGGLLVAKIYIEPQKVPRTKQCPWGMKKRDSTYITLGGIP